MEKESVTGKLSEAMKSGIQQVKNWHTRTEDYFVGTLKWKVNKQLLISKGFYFFFFAGFGTLMPYLSLYYQNALLLSKRQAAILMGIQPLCLLFGAPVLGTVADKHNKFRHVLVASLLAYILTYLCITFVPAIDVDCPGQFHFSNQTRMWYEDPLSIYGGYNYDEIILNDESAVIPRIAVTGAKEKQGIREIFIILVVLTVFGEFIARPANTLADTATLQNLGEDSTEYGYQRLWGSLGLGMMAFITGAIISYRDELRMDCPEDFMDIYKPCFYAFGIFMSIALFISTFFRFQQSDDSTSKRGCLGFFRGIKIFSTPRYSAFAFIAAFTGLCRGMAHSFLFVHISDIGGSSALFSLVTGIHCLSDTLVYLYSRSLINNLGHMVALYIGLAVYSVQFLSYSFIYNPWLIIPVELLKGVSDSLVWAALVTYVGTPPKVGATLQGVLHGIHFGLGQGIGGLFGGLLIHRYGFNILFRYFSLVVILVLILFVTVGLLENGNGSEPIWKSLQATQYSLVDSDYEEVDDIESELIPQPTNLPPDTPEKTNITALDEAFAEETPKQ